MNETDIRDYIEFLILYHRLSLRTLARRSGVSASTISRYLNQKDIKLSIFFSIVNALDKELSIVAHK